MLRRRVPTKALQVSRICAAAALGCKNAAPVRFGHSVQPSSTEAETAGGGCPMSGASKSATPDASRSVCPMSGMAKTGCPAEEDNAPQQLRFSDIVNQMGKMRLSAFVTGTASAGYILCGGTNLIALGAVTAGTYLLSLSANTANQYLEVEHDRLMKRTSKRPLVIGAITPFQALQLSAAEFALGSAVLGMTSGPAMALGAANWAMYVGVYTPLKRRSTTNTWWGAIVGAVPPLMGGVAATGGILSIANPAIQPAYVLGGLVFGWQIPHFMSLAFFCRRDYEAAGFKMLPYHHPTRASVYAVAMSVAMAALTVFGLPYGALPVESWYLVLASVANALMIYKSWMFHQDPVKYCRSCFVFSYMYLAVMIVLLCVNHAQPVALSQRLYRRYYPDNTSEAAAAGSGGGACQPLIVAQAPRSSSS